LISTSTAFRAIRHSGLPGSRIIAGIQDQNSFYSASMGSYDDALIFVGASALLAIFSCVVIVGDIKRLELHSFPQIAAM